MPGELTDAEVSILLSLDAESPLWELLMPIVWMEGRKRTQTRGSLDFADAAEALASLAAQGLVELRVMRDDVDNWNELPLVPGDRIQTIVSDPSNWEVPSEAPATYWAATTDQGEAAYRRWSEARGGPWIEAPPLGSQGRVERLRHRLGVPATMPRRVYMESWWKRALARRRRR